MIQRQYPDGICAQKNGLRVRVQRNKVLLAAFVPWSHPAPLARAIEVRDKFLATAGEIQYPKSKKPLAFGRSNTGYAGICEMTRWFKGRPQAAFNVTWSVRGQRFARALFYQGLASREKALNRAMALRQQKTGVAYV